MCQTCSGALKIEALSRFAFLLQSFSGDAGSAGTSGVAPDGSGLGLDVRSAQLPRFVRQRPLPPQLPAPSPPSTSSLTAAHFGHRATHLMTHVASGASFPEQAPRQCHQQSSAAEENERCPDAMAEGSAGQSSSPACAGVTAQQHQASASAHAGASPQRVAFLAEKKRKVRPTFKRKLPQCRV